jgi:aldose 1-epimerase
MKTTETRYGTAPDGSAVKQLILETSRGARVSAISYGATLTSVEMPDRSGNRANVILSHRSMEGYAMNAEFFGAFVGRFANRISGGRFALDGREYSLARNDGANHIHGGLRGFDKINWSGKLFKKGDSAGIRWTGTSANGDEGYPGRLKVTFEYVLTENNVFSFEYWAEADAPTPVNLTNHSYWNLAGAGTILDQEISFNCPFYLPSTPELIPTGEVLATAGTPFDFSIAKKIGKDIAAIPGGGYDHCLVIDKTAGTLALACTARDPVSGRTMRVSTTKPGIQFYTGNFLQGDEHPRHSGFCLETQHFPDAPNRGHFPSAILRPGQVYHHRTVHEFSV